MYLQYLTRFKNVIGGFAVVNGDKHICLMTYFTQVIK